MSRSIRQPLRAAAAMLCAFAAAGASPLPHPASFQMTATGTFTVRIDPQGEPSTDGGVSLGAMSLSKEFEGDLIGTGEGTMLTARTPVETSAGYVAIERFTGELHGRAGSFVLQHNGVMHAGEQRLSIEIVPESGTGELAGITGSLALQIVDGVHHYTLEYSLSDAGDGPAAEAHEGPPTHVHHGIDYIEINVTDMSAAQAFYASAFSWEFTDYAPDYAGIRKEVGEAGGLRTVEQVAAGGPLVILYSAELDATLAAVREAGGEIVQEPFEFPGGRRFHFLDPAGNQLAVWSER